MVSLTAWLAQMRGPDEVERRAETARKWLPNWLLSPIKNFNFIFFHYVYLVMWTIVGSIVIYPAGGMGYTDALFFSAGAATQSGLNTIDVNRLNTYQQVC
jgi:hypothetical protein